MSTANLTALPEEILVMIVRQLYRRTVVKIASEADKQAQERKQSHLAIRLTCKALYDVIGATRAHREDWEENASQKLPFTPRR